MGEVVSFKGKIKPNQQNKIKEYLDQPLPVQINICMLWIEKLEKKIERLDG